MRVIVHHPSGLEEKEELARRVSEAHSRAVVAQIADLPINDQEQLWFLKSIIGTYT